MTTDGWTPPGGAASSITTDGDTIQGTGASASPIALRQVHTGAGLTGLGTAASPLAATAVTGGGGSGSLCPPNPTFIFFPPGNTILGNDGAGHVIYDNIGGFTYDGSVAGQIDAWSDAANSPPQTVSFAPNGGASHPTYDPASKCLILPNQWSGYGGSVALNTARATVVWYGKGLSDITGAQGGGIIGWGSHGLALRDAGSGNLGVFSDGYTVNGTINGGLGNFVALLFDIAPPNINCYYSLAPFTGWTWFFASSGWFESSPVGVIGIGTDLGGSIYRNGTRYFGTYGYWPRALSGTLGTTPTGEYLSVLQMVVGGNPQPPYVAALQGSLASQGAMNTALKAQVRGMTQGTVLLALPDTEALPWYQGAPDATIPLRNASLKYGQLLFPPMKAWDYGGGNWGYSITSPIPIAPTGGLWGMNSWLYAANFASNIHGVDSNAFGLPMVFSMWQAGAQQPSLQIIEQMMLVGNQGYSGNQKIVGILNENCCRTVYRNTHVDSCYIGYVDLDPQYQHRYYRHAVNCYICYQISNDSGGGLVDYIEADSMHIAWVQANNQAAGWEGIGHLLCGSSGQNGSTGGGFPLNLKGRWTKSATSHVVAINPNPRFVGSISGTTLTVTQWISGYPLRGGMSIGAAPGAPGFAALSISAYGTGVGFTGTYTLSGSATVASQLMSSGNWFGCSFRLEGGSSEYSWGGQGGENEWSPTYYWWAPNDYWLGTWKGYWAAGTTYAKGDIVYHLDGMSHFMSTQAGNIGHPPQGGDSNSGFTQPNPQYWIDQACLGIMIPFQTRGAMIYLQPSYAMYAKNLDSYDDRTIIYSHLEDGAYQEWENVSVGGNGTTIYGIRARGPNAKTDFVGLMPLFWGLQSVIYENVQKRPAGLRAGFASGNFGESAYGNTGPGPIIMSSFAAAEYEAGWAMPSPYQARSIPASGTSGSWTNSTNFSAWVTFTGGTAVAININSQPLPTGIHFGGPVVVPAGAVLSWTDTVAPTITFALPIGTHYSPINSQGNAIGPNRYVVPMTGSTGKVTIATATDVDLAQNSFAPVVGGTPPWVTMGGANYGTVQVGSITFATGSDPVLDYAITPYGAGAASQTTFGDGGYSGGAGGAAHTMFGLELKLATPITPDGVNGDHPGYSHVRVIPYMSAFGQPVHQDGGTGNSWGCNPYMNQNPVTISMPAGPQTGVQIWNPFGTNFSIGKARSNGLVTVSGGTNVVARPGPGGWLRWPGGANGAASSSPFNQGTGNTVTYLENTNGVGDSDGMYLDYTVAPTVTVSAAHPTGVTLWYGKWMFVSIYYFANRDAQFALSLMKTNTAPITILYRKFTYLRAKYDEIDMFNHAYQKGAWW